MSNQEVMELLKMLSDAVNYSDKHDLNFGDHIADIIGDIKNYYNID